MRIYSASSEETLRARQLLTDWASEGYLTEEKYQQLESEMVSDLRTTNIFLRLVLFLFTLIIVAAAVGLFFVVLLSHPSESTTGVFCLIFAALCYTAAELLVSQVRLYRFGIEEALAVCSVGFLCFGMQLAFFSGIAYSAKPDAAQILVPIAGAVFCLWIWRRFGLWYAFPAAMICVLFLPGYWTFSHSAQRSIIAMFYAIGLICIRVVRTRHRFDYLNEVYSLVEAFLWLGLYLVINLQLWSLSLKWWTGPRPESEFVRPFYWTTWVLTWCLPPIVLTRGIRHKDRFVISVGAIVAILTFLTNKPYLGWQRHTWDPMLLGILLIAVATSIRRWLAKAPGGIRHGFTAERISGKDKLLTNAGSAVLGLLTPESITPAPQTSAPSFHFDGGKSGGGGASSDF